MGKRGDFAKEYWIYKKAGGSLGMKAYADYKKTIQAGEEYKPEAENPKEDIKQPENI